MADIKCPECGAIIQLDETSYARVATQIRDTEFHRALEEREQLFRADAEKQVQMAVMNKEKDMTDVISSRDLRIKDLEAEIEKLKSERTLDIKNAVEAKEKQISDLENKIGTFDLEKDLAYLSLPRDNRVKMPFDLHTFLSDGFVKTEYERRHGFGKEDRPFIQLQLDIPESE